MIEDMRKEPMELLGDFGENLGYDGKAIRSNSTGNRDRKTGKRSDPDADWGKHEYSGVDSSAKAWTKIKTWFGYRLHIIADTKYEIPVAFSLTGASVRSSVSWRRAYNRRSALERINSRIEGSFGFGGHFIRGKQR